MGWQIHTGAVFVCVWDDMMGMMLGALPAFCDFRFGLIYHTKFLQKINCLFYEWLLMNFTITLYTVSITFVRDGGGMKK